MRYLNKIVFINSAAIRYSEVQLDGNIHLIGTQGVGKSTILRAILFFYNADTQRLGIPVEKKSYQDYYFPYADSSIIYEVAREDGWFTVLSYKTMNRICYRFIASPYRPDLFIDEEGAPYPSDRIRSVLDKNGIKYSGAISTYEEYRNILYGNSDNKRDYSCYSLMESGSYQNIIRTIQNVLLNSRLEADYIKQTIITSLNEADSVIDLSRYRSHLSGFEAQLNDIGHRLYVAEGEKEKHLAEREKLLKACRKVYNGSRTELRKELEEFVASVQQEIERMKQQTEERKKELKQVQENELNGKGADTVTIRKYDDRLAEINKELDYIGKSRPQVLYYEKDKEELFDKEPATRSRKKEQDAKLVALDERIALKKEKLQVQKKGADEHLERIGKELHLLEDGLNKVDMFRKDEIFCPPSVIEIGEKPTRKNCDVIVEELKSLIVSTIRKTEEFKKAVTQFNGNFSSKNTFHFRTELVGEQDYYDFASNLCEFVDNDKISDYQKHISERYTDIIRRISQEVGGLTRNESEIHRTIKDINDDFVKRNFAGVIKEIALRPLQSSDKLMQLLLEIKRFSDENQYNMGKVDLFSQDSREDVNAVAVRHLLSFMKFLLDDFGRRRLALTDTFKLEFRVKENDNDTGWVEKIANVGSDGTDILVKAMVNIMLINVFKEKASRKFGDFKIHCMMDEIGKLHPNNVKGILDFANCRNILLVNSSPTTYNVEDYRYTYLLSKDGRSNTQVVPLLTYNKIEK